MIQFFRYLHDPIRMLSSLFLYKKSSQLLIFVCLFSRLIIQNCQGNWIFPHCRWTNPLTSTIIHLPTSWPFFSGEKCVLTSFFVMSHRCRGEGSAPSEIGWFYVHLCFMTVLVLKKTFENHRRSSFIEHGNTRKQ